MRQLSDVPPVDEVMYRTSVSAFRAEGFRLIDAQETTGSKNYLDRILNLIRGTAFTLAIYSEETRATAFANISLELGFAVMCGKPLVIVKSPDATPPSDLKMTDWIEYHEDRPDDFFRIIQRAARELRDIAANQQMLFEVAIDADDPDCAVAFERLQKAFLLTGNPDYLGFMQNLVDRVQGQELKVELYDLNRLLSEMRLFHKQMRSALA